MQTAMVTLLSRPGDLGIRSISFVVERHMYHDAGCRTRCSDWLRRFINAYDYAIVVFDRDGCGSGGTREEIQAEVESTLNINGWRDRCRAIVIEPELESWVWNSTQATARLLGWGRYSELRKWLENHDLWPKNSPKPPDPKQALDRVRKDKRLRRSATLFEDIAKEARMGQCQDTAFVEFKSTLQAWFPQ